MCDPITVVFCNILFDYWFVQFYFYLLLHYGLYVLEKLMENFHWKSSVCNKRDSPNITEPTAKKHFLTISTPTKKTDEGEISHQVVKQLLLQRRALRL